VNAQTAANKARVAVHKFSSCDGCQLAFLNLGEALLALARQVDIVHFAEAGPIDAEQNVDVAFVEGSISTPEDIERIRLIRENSAYLIAIGACATSGGLQALRNLHDANEWKASVYPKPEVIALLDTSTPIAKHVHVDLELQGCPVTSTQVVDAVKSLLAGFVPEERSEKVCLECKRQGNVCVLVTGQQLCMGPVTQTGCGALCPSYRRDCYGCFGVAENINPASLAHQFEQLNASANRIAHRLLFINSGSEVLKNEGSDWLKKQDD